MKTTKSFKTAERRPKMAKIPENEVVRIVSTGKDPRTGRIVTQEHRIKGAVMITTTAALLDEELLSRCLMLTLAPEDTP
jgi:hypothetical protein